MSNHHQMREQERMIRRANIEYSYRLRHRKVVNLLNLAHMRWEMERQGLEQRIAAAEEKSRYLQEQARILEMTRMPCHELVGGQMREVELPLGEVLHRLAFGCPGTDTHLGVTSVETPDAQAAWEQWPVTFADPPASPDATLTTDAQERACGKTANKEGGGLDDTELSTNEIPDRRWDERQAMAAKGAANSSKEVRNQAEVEPPSGSDR